MNQIYAIKAQRFHYILASQMFMEFISIIYQTAISIAKKEGYQEIVDFLKKQANID